MTENIWSVQEQSRAATKMASAVLSALFGAGDICV